MDRKYRCAIVAGVFNLLLIVVPGADAAALPDACSLLTAARVAAAEPYEYKASRGQCRRQQQLGYGKGATCRCRGGNDAR